MKKPKALSFLIYPREGRLGRTHLKYTSYRAYGKNWIAKCGAYKISKTSYCFSYFKPKYPRSYQQTIRVGKCNVNLNFGELSSIYYLNQFGFDIYLIPSHWIKWMQPIQRERRKDDNYNSPLTVCHQSIPILSGFRYLWLFSLVIFFSFC